MSIAMFLVGMLVSMLDPISLVGCAIAGMFIQSYPGAITAGVAWRMLAHFFIVLPAAKLEQQSIPSNILFQGILGAGVVTSIAYFLADRSRRRKLEESECARPNKDGTESVGELGIGITESLIQAVIDNDVPRVRQLLRDGANPEHVGKDGYTAKDFARGRGHSEITAIFESA